MAKRYSQEMLDRAAAAKKSLERMRAGGGPLDLDREVQRIQMEREARAARVVESGPLKARGEDAAARFAKVVEVLRSEAEEAHRQYSDEPFDAAAWSSELAASPENLREQVELVAPGLIDDLARVKSEGEARIADVREVLSARTAPYLSRIPATSAARQTLDQVLIESAIYEDDEAAAQARTLRRLVEAGHAADLLDAAGGDPDREQALFEAAVSGPTLPPPPDPYAGMTDEQVEAALAEQAGRPRVTSDRPLPEGMVIETEYTAHDADGYEQLQREVAEMEKSDAAAGNPAAATFQRFFRP